VRIAGTEVVVVGVSVVVVVAAVDPIPHEANRNTAAGIYKMDRRDLSMSYCRHCFY
jgi:hypothetical protein